MESLEAFLKAKKAVKQCLVCAHPERAAIDKALKAGYPQSHVAQWIRTTDHPMSDSVVRNHRLSHLG